jgi:hypothetical protein
VLENNTWYDYLALDPDVYLSRDYAPMTVRMDAYTRHVQGIPAAVAAMRETIEPMPSGHAGAGIAPGGQLDLGTPSITP